MELKVSVEGVERSVSGIDENTTCAQIIYALAHATAQKGRFAMIERFRNVERRLSPNDKPLEMLEKWGEHGSNVTFIVKRIENDDAHGTQTGTTSIAPRNASTSSLPAFPGARPPPPDYRTVMAQRTGSVGFPVQSRPPIPFRRDDPMDTFHGMNSIELQNLIDKQSNTLEQMRHDRQRNAEVPAPPTTEIELIQLVQQQENLHKVLERLRAEKWPEQYQQELKKSHRLRAAIEATKEAASKCHSDFEKLKAEEDDLLRQLDMMENVPHSSEDSSFSSPSPNNQNAKLQTC